MRDDPESMRQYREQNEPSSLDIIGAYAPSEHLKLFYVGNTNRDRIYVLASSRHFATIVAMMGGHIRHLRNATLWRPLLSTGRGSAVAQAIRDGLPGQLWARDGHIIMRHKVYYDEHAAGN